MHDIKRRQRYVPEIKGSLNKTSLGAFDQLLDVVRCLPLEAQLLSLCKCVVQAIIPRSYPVSDLAERLNILVQPAHQGLAICQANISIHLGITRGQACHISEAC